MHKLTTLITAALLVAAVSSTALSAQPANSSTSQRLSAVEQNIYSLATGLDSLEAHLSSVESDFKSVVEENTAAIEKVRKEVKSANDSQKNVVRKVRDYSEIAMKWVALFIFAVFLPILLVRLYQQHNRENQRRYDIIVDLIRSGVEIKPEMQEYLTGSYKQTVIGGSSMLSGMNEGELKYCSRRLLWGLTAFIIGGGISILAHTGEPFTIALCIALFFILQAVIRYFSVKYFIKHKDDQKTDAE